MDYTIMETIKHIQQSSIEISKNSKGYTFSVKAYGDTEQEISDKTDKLMQSAEDKIAKKQLVKEVNQW